MSNNVSATENAIQVILNGTNAASGMSISLSYNSGMYVIVFLGISTQKREVIRAILAKKEKGFWKKSKKEPSI